VSALQRDAAHYPVPMPGASCGLQEPQPGPSPWRRGVGLLCARTPSLVMHSCPDRSPPHGCPRAHTCPPARRVQVHGPYHGACSVWQASTVRGQGRPRGSRPVPCACA
jgi:hypothetical protein